MSGGYVYIGERTQRRFVRRCNKRPCSKNPRTPERTRCRIYKEVFDKAHVYFEHYEEIQAAIQREHNMKHWSRKWKVRLILANNPAWNDLYDSNI